MKENDDTKQSKREKGGNGKSNYSEGQTEEWDELLTTADVPSPPLPPREAEENVQEHWVDPARTINETGWGEIEDDATPREGRTYPGECRHFVKGHGERRQICEVQHTQETENKYHRADAEKKRRKRETGRNGKGQ